MPSTSAKQAKFMRAVANSPKFAKKVGVPQSVGKDYEMADKKRKKFSEGGRAERMRERRMADIEKDYQKALAKGKSDKEAKAKRDQRIADARDDYAKRTGADRTETRAAEKAAEARLTAARRSPDKFTRPVSVTAEGSKPLETAKIDLTEKVSVPKVSMDEPKRSAARPARAPLRRPVESKPTPKYGANFGKPEVGGKANKTPATPPKTPATPPKDKSAGKEMIEMSARRQQAQIDELGGTLRNLLSAPVAAYRRIQAAGRANDPTLKKAKGGKVKKYAKGGKIDGIAVRGKTRAKRKK